MSTTDLALFDYENHQVRVITLDGEPWFVLADLCKVLGIGNTADVAARLDDDMKGVDQIDTPGGRQRVTIVSEPGMYEVVIRSDKPNAVAFRRWLTTEVLPSIRKTGAYLTRHSSSIDAIQAMVDQLREQERLTIAAQTTADRAEAKALETAARVDGIEGRSDWFSALGWARLNGLPDRSAATLRRLGLKARLIARARGVEPAKAPHELYGEVNILPAWAWEDAAIDLGLLDGEVA